MSGMWISVTASCASVACLGICCAKGLNRSLDVVARIHVFVMSCPSTSDRTRSRTPTASIVSGSGAFIVRCDTRSISHPLLGRRCLFVVGTFAAVVGRCLAKEEVLEPRDEVSVDWNSNLFGDVLDVLGVRMLTSFQQNGKRPWRLLRLTGWRKRCNTWWWRHGRL